MNVADHQEKEKNERTGKREAGEERKQANDFKKDVCCPFAVVQGQHGKKMVCKRRVLGVTENLREDQRPFRSNPNGSGTAPPC